MQLRWLPSSGLGTYYSQAPACNLGKPELPKPHSQAGASLPLSPIGQTALSFAHAERNRKPRFTSTMRIAARARQALHSNIILEDSRPVSPSVGAEFPDSPPTSNSVRGQFLDAWTVCPSVQDNCEDSQNIRRSLPAVCLDSFPSCRSLSALFLGSFPSRQSAPAACADPCRFPRSVLAG